MSDRLADDASKQGIAGLFSVSERTVESWVRMRLLPPVRLGRTGLCHVPILRQHRAAAAAPDDRGRRRS